MQMVNTGSEPSRANMFWACFSRKDGKTPEEVSQAWVYFTCFKLLINIITLDVYVCKLFNP